ncbi:hypothetical protein SCLCIDRAFT_142191, partial [Scleroderma citrinum Foug A]
DLLEMAVTKKHLEQVYLQASDRDTYECLCESVHEMGRAQELFLINSQGLASGTPMDIGAASVRPQQRGRGPQCYNCQDYGHIARECTKPRCPRQQQTQVVQPKNDDNERIKAVQGMSFSEMRDCFWNLKD